MESMRQGYGPLLGSVSHVDHQSPEALEAEIERVGAGNVAAFFCEPVIGAGGVRPAPPGYIEAVAAICKRPRRAARDRQRDLRVRTRRHLVRATSAGTSSPTWSCSPRASRAATCRSAACSSATRSPSRSGPSRAGRCSATERPMPATRRVAPLRSPTSPSSSASSLIPRGRELEGELMDMLAPLADHAACGEIRGGLGLAAAVDLHARGAHERARGDGALRGRDPRGGRAAARAGDGRRDRPAAHDRAARSCDEIAGAVRAGLDAVAAA